ncbi:acetylornithine transaminase [Rarobacter faecitabidus]|uniref:Acetylornithine aminotransferase n=1 Tax=Rarobacter faecitabidus TaxID=13243 RepID=A0A542ZW38_RARFA|nr:acetylornithine transaminase [Rarobacter faecitabidus]TQL64583.1 acetylornithine aminotransferase [Rarobacter faecitabidus]
MSDLATDDAGQVAASTGGLASVSGWTQRYTGALLDVFGPPQTVLVRGEGAYVFDADGKRYLDLLAGIAVNALGHAHPALTGAVSAQLSTLGHVSNFFATPTQIGLAEKLLEVSGAPEGSRVFFTNSGTEANEAAFKLARRNNESGNRTRILALTQSFHGRTMGALALTSKAAYREPFEPLPGGVEFIEAGDITALEAAFANGETVAAVFLEVIQGEGGVRQLPVDYLRRVRELTRQHGALFVVDEVQTGIGRTGNWLAFQDPVIGGGIVPDVVTLAKGLGGGIPIGALVTFGPGPSGLFSRGQHGTTFGGNPVAAAAGLATLHVIERDGLLDSVRALGACLVDEFSALAANADTVVADVRGAGLLLGVELTGEWAAAVVALAREAGFIVNAVTPSTIRIAPPLIVTREQLQTFIDFVVGLSPERLAEENPA